MLDIPCADDGQLAGADLEQICRLCLQMDDLMICIYDRLDPNPKKRPLSERILELFQIEVAFELTLFLNGIRSEFILPSEYP